MYRLPPPPPAPSYKPDEWASAGRPKPGWRWLRWLIVLAVWGGLALACLVAVCAWDLPRPDSALGAVRRPGLTLTDQDGEVFATYGDLVGEKVHLADLPPALPAAAVAVEDRRFWSHWGIDLPGVARAAFVNLRAGRVVQGGSTITQQVAKNLFLSRARTFRRKVQEVLLTLWLEEHFTKQEILEIWLNRVYLGGGAWGVDAASRLYFGVPAARLEVWQCAVIAGLPRAPSRFNPRADPRAAVARGRDVLAAMAASGALTAAQAQDAAARIAFPPPPPSGGYFADWAAEQAQAVIPSGTDAVVRTTLDRRLQGVAQTRLAALLAGPGAAAGATQGAVVVLDAAGGAVRALVGGRDYRASPFNRAVAARRQPGSAFKPFVWLAALEHGMQPDDTVPDAPITVGGWSPENFDGKFRGEVTLTDALAESLNTVSVRLLQAAGGPAPVAAVARRLGIASRLTENATLALGTSDVGILEIASAYAPFFNGGLRTAPTAIESVAIEGGAPPLPPSPPESVVDPDRAVAMVAMMAAVVLRGSGRAAAIAGRAVAGKTGTTQDYRDAWFVGGVGGKIIAVWIGNDDGQPMHDVTGGSLPAQLFREIALELR